jgi:hypothetical protein
MTLFKTVLAAIIVYYPLVVKPIANIWSDSISRSNEHGD